MSSPFPSFKDLALSAPVVQAIQSIGYEQPSPIQAASIPHLLHGDDLLGIAQTGTGKTAAFALPLLSKLNIRDGLRQGGSPQILVLTPTRELAIQVAEAFRSYAAHMVGFHVLPIYGGQEMGGQLRQLKRGVHVVVGTPGRIMDHMRRGSLKLDKLACLVLDEADEMLRMGFIDDVEWILEYTPTQRQTALFSATMPPAIKKVADKYLNNPKEVRIASETKTAEHIEQSYLVVHGFDRKLDAITRIMEAQDFDAMIVFVRTKTATVELAEKLEARGYSASPLNGDMNQSLRERAIQRLKRRQLDIVVATDVAARGLDVDRISHVVNFDIPYDSEAYVHRIGRTGRAGRKGVAILFVAPREKRLLYSIEKSTRQRIVPMQLPTGAEVSGRRIDQFKQLLTDTLSQQDLKFYDQVLSEYSRESEQSLENIASALAYLVQRERPLQVKDAAPQRFVERASKRDRNNSTNGHYKKNTTDRYTYRVEVGREIGVKPGDLVGALANEGGIDSRVIGQIKIHGQYSTIALSKKLAGHMLEKLRYVKVRHCPLMIRPMRDGAR